MISAELQKLSAKMFTLVSVKGILEFMGLLLDIEFQNGVVIRTKNPLHFLKNIVITIPLVLLLFPLCAYFYFNLNILMNATDVFYVIAATILCMGQYWFLVVQKVPLQRVLIELQAIVDQSNYQQ